MCLSYFFFSYKIIFIFIILALNVINVLSYYEIVVNHSNVIVSTLSWMENENCDVTTIYKVTDFQKNISNEAGFKSKGFGSIFHNKYSIEVHPRTNAIGLPITIDNLLDDTEIPIDTTFPYDTFIQAVYDPDDWNSSFTSNSGDMCEPETNSYLSSLSGKGFVECLNVMEYINSKSIEEKDFINFLNITWEPKETVNSLAIQYVFNHNALYSIIIYIYDENNEQLYFSNLDRNVNKTTLIIKNLHVELNKIYTIMFLKHGNKITDLPEFKTYFGLYQITKQYIPEIGKNIKITLPAFQNNLKNYLTPYHVVGSSRENLNNKTISNCLNGGYKLIEQNMCICPPGFKGKLCEIACGPNTFGADCNSRCSFYKKGCKGMYMCTSSFGCTCPTGLTGPLCNQNCPIHKYGNDCTQNCSSLCFNQTCNQYTGVCSKGCPSPYIPPNCIEKYTYLLNAPELVSAYNNAINIKINFTSNNMNSDKGLQYLKQYQILYKTPNDTTYTHSKSKLLHLNQVEEVTINNLKSDTTYTIGVLLIRNDGHYNDKNIAFKNYKTPCKIPELLSNDYNIKVTQNSSTTKISWDKIPLTREHCKITKYVLTLTNKDDEDHFIEHFTIENTNNTSYDIDDLIANYEYSLNLTAWVSLGPLPSSPVYNFTPTYKEQDRDIGIEDIQANTMENNYTIQVSWKFVNYDKDNSSISEPPTIVKYKINRIFSCSLDEIKDATWNSIPVHGKTSCEISNVTPNAQYMIQVVLHSEDKNENSIQRKNVVYALIPATKPSLEPFLTEPLIIANNSVTVKWNIDSESCSKLNGDFLGFLVILYSEIYNQTFEYITKEYNYVSSYNLKPDTDYEIKVYALNDIGYNDEHFLLKNFTTKIIKPVPIVDDLLIYKKSVKNKILGLRWKYSNASSIKNKEQFKIAVYGTNTSNSILQKDIELEKCSIWPEFYCYTIEGVDFQHINEVKVTAPVSLNGSETSSVIYKPTDKHPSKPLNFKASNVTSTTAILGWDIPWVFNGLLHSFIINIQCLPNENENKVVKNVTEEKSHYDHKLRDLTPGSTYSIDLVAVSNTQHHSPPATIEITTK